MPTNGSRHIGIPRENIEQATEATRRSDFSARAGHHLEFHMIPASATRNPILIVVMQALIEIMRHFIHSIGSRQIEDYVLPSRKRFMLYFEAGNADAAVEEMERHLKRVNRNHLALLEERSKSREIVAGRSRPGAPCVARPRAAD